jgi:peptidoglycan hydrolase CwlO-like protein
MLIGEKDKNLNQMSQKVQELEKMLEEKDEEILELMSEVDTHMVERP